jgi:cysteinyl-tRNA synthetase
MQDTSVSVANYGGTYDVHGGAAELKYPHHGAHLAQLRALTKTNSPVRFWMYVGLVTKNKEKMSKSAHNTVRIRDVLRKYGPNALRLYLYSRHYAAELDFEEEALRGYLELEEMIYDSMEKAVKVKSSRYFKPFLAKIANDLDTPSAIELVRRAAVKRDSGLRLMARLIGLE